MTDKQKKFCEEYVIDLNATQAAIRAGYSEKTANRIGSENLSKLDIQNYIAELQEESQERNQIKRDDIVGELKKIGFADINFDNIQAKDKLFEKSHTLYSAKCH